MIGKTFDAIGYFFTAFRWLATVIFSKDKFSDGIKVLMSSGRNAVTINYFDPASVQIYLHLLNNTPFKQTASHFTLRFWHGGTSVQLIPDYRIVIPAHKDIKVYLQGCINPAQSLAMAKSELGHSEPRIEYNISFENLVHSFEVSGNLDNLAIEQQNKDHRLKAA